MSKPKKAKTHLVYITMAAAVFAVGVGVAFTQLKTNSHAAAQVKQLSAAAGASSDGGSGVAAGGDVPPEETRPKNISSYAVPATQPRYIRISKIGVDARIRRLGVNAKSELQAPTNVHDAGWYEDSAKPGDAGGAMLIDGHVHGPSLPGVFANLKKLAVGDKIEVERGDGKKVSFKVVKLQSYPADKVDMAAALTPVVPGKLGLNLITCNGKIAKGTTHYEERLIVFATAE